MLRRARRVLRRLRSTDTCQRGDPVFNDGDYEPEDVESAVAHRHATATWEALERTLTIQDFPLRVVFLDKSGSMGCDAVTYDALNLGLHSCLNPNDGSTLTFLFAGPGETQVILRRPRDP